MCNHLNDSFGTMTHITITNSGKNNLKMIIWWNWRDLNHTEHNLQKEFYLWRRWAAEDEVHIYVTCALTPFSRWLARTQGEIFIAMGLSVRGFRAVLRRETWKGGCHVMWVQKLSVESLSNPGLTGERCRYAGDSA